MKLWGFIESTFYPTYSILYDLGTLKSLIDEDTGISEQTGIFLDIQKRAGPKYRRWVKMIIMIEQEKGTEVLNSSVEMIIIRERP